MTMFRQCSKSNALPFLAMILFSNLQSYVTSASSDGVHFFPEGTCPIICFCNIPSNIVYCSRRGLTSIPTDISPDTLQLNLNGNAFHSGTIRHVNMSGYISLEHLYMSECSIDTIEVGAFSSLTSLKWLDLSNNQIKLIQANTFDGLTLQHLFLNGNRNIHLLQDSFYGLITSGLYVHDCSLTVITPETLDPLKNHLRYLWLNGNEIVELDPRFRETFARLLHLRLASNSLRCDCASIWLKEFYDKTTAIFNGAAPPSCLSPTKLKGKQFSELSLFDYRCRPPTFSSVDVHMPRGSQPGRLRCVANSEPAPVVYWIQPSGKTTKFKPSAEDETSINEASITLYNPVNDEDGENLSEKEGDASNQLNGMYICFAKNDAGNVTVTLNVPWSNTAASILPRTYTSNAGKVSEGPIKIDQPRSSSPILRNNVLNFTRRINPFNFTNARNDHEKTNITARVVEHLNQDITFRNVNYTHLEREPFEHFFIRLNSEFTLNELLAAMLITHVITLAVSVSIAFAVIWCCRTRVKDSQIKSSAVSVQETDETNSCVRSTEGMFSAERNRSGEKEKSLIEYPTGVISSENIYLKDKRYPTLRIYTTSPIFR